MPTNKLVFKFSSDQDQEQQIQKTPKEHQVNTNYSRINKIINLQKKEQKGFNDKYRANKMQPNLFFKDNLENNQYFEEFKQVEVPKLKQPELINLPGIKKPALSNLKLHRFKPIKDPKNIEVSQFQKSPIIQYQLIATEGNNRTTKNQTARNNAKNKHLNFSFTESSDSSQCQKSEKQKNFKKKSSIKPSLINPQIIGQNKISPNISQKPTIKYKGETNFVFDDESSNQLAQQPNKKFQDSSDEQNKLSKASSSLAIEVSEKHQGSNSLSLDSIPAEKCPKNKIKHFLLSPIKEQQMISLKVTRNNKLINFFSPQYYVELSNDRHFLFAAKKTSSKPQSNFVFSSEKQSFQQSTMEYLGKMKSTGLRGNVFNIFDRGLNRTLARTLNVYPRQLLATIVFTTQIFGTGKPREFKVFLKRPEFNYSTDFIGMDLYGDELPLNQLYERFEENHNKVRVFRSRKPHFDANRNQYVLDFMGKAKLSSIKNFILDEEGQEGKAAILFGKMSEEEYNLDIFNPFSPVMGLSIALTMFESILGST